MPVVGAVVGAAIAVGGAVFASGTLATALIVAGTTLLDLSLSSLDLAGRQGGIKQNVSGTQEPLPLVYGGPNRLGVKWVDVRVDDNSPDRKDLVLVGAVCVGSEDGNGIEGIQNVYFNDRLAVQRSDPTDAPTTGNHRSEFEDADNNELIDWAIYRGTDAQSVDSELNSRFPDAWPSTSDMTGIAYIRLILTYDKEVFASGIPTVTCDVYGQRVYDPRDPSGGPNNNGYKHLENPTLCALDLLASDRYGGGFDRSSLIHEQSFIDQANADTNSCTGWLNTDDDVLSNLERILSSNRGRLIYQNGKYRIHVKDVQTPVSFELTEDNIIGNWNFRRAGHKNTANKVVASYVDPLAEYEAVDVVWPEPGTDNDFLAADNDFQNTKEIQLAMTQSDSTAQDIAEVLLAESRRDLVAEVTAEEEAMVLEVGDVVNLSHSTGGFDQQPCWVEAMGLGAEGKIRLGLREYDASAYMASAKNPLPGVPGTNLPDPSTIANVTINSTSSGASEQLNAAGDSVLPRVRVAWTPPSDPFYDHAEVLAKRTEDSDGNPVTEDYFPVLRIDSSETLASGDQQAQFIVGQEGETWEVKVVAVNRLGIRASGVTDTVSLTVDAASVLSVRYATLQLKSGDYDLSGHVRGGAESVRFATSTSAFPSRSTTQSGTVVTVDSDNQFELLDAVSGGSVQAGETLFVSLLAYENNDGTGDESIELYKTKAFRSQFSYDVGWTPDRDNTDWNTLAWLGAGIQTNDGRQWTLNGGSFTATDDEYHVIYFDPTVSTTEVQVEPTSTFSLTTSTFRMGVFKRGCDPATVSSDFNCDPLISMESGQVVTVNAEHIQDNLDARDKVADGSVIAGKLSESSRQFATDIVFSATDADTVNWTAGDVELADGTTYSINSGNTGDMASDTYIYLDSDTSTTALQTSTIASDATGERVVLLCFAKPATANDQTAFFLPAVGEVGFNEEQISANIVASNILKADTVTATEVNVAQLDALSANVGTLTGGTLENAGGTNVIDLDASGNDLFITTPNLTIEADGDAVFEGEVASQDFTASTAHFTNELLIGVPSTGDVLNGTWARMEDDGFFWQDGGGMAAAISVTASEFTIESRLGFVDSGSKITMAENLTLSVADGDRVVLDDESVNTAPAAGVIVSTSSPSGDYPEGTIWCQV